MRAEPVTILWVFLAGQAVLAGLMAVDFLVFHTLAELFAVAVGLSLFFVSATVRGGRAAIVLKYLGAGYFWVALLDLMHTVTYEGMGLHPLGGANTAVQFWLSGRLIETLLLLTMPLILARGRAASWAFMLYGAAAAGLYWAIDQGRFPLGYVVGEGLTPFKIQAEAILVATLAAALGLTRATRRHLDRPVYLLVQASIAMTMGAELLFTTYIGVTDLSNGVGHLLKVASYWCILLALLRRRPREDDLVEEHP